MPLKRCHCVDNQIVAPCLSCGGFCGFLQKSFRVARIVQQNWQNEGMIEEEKNCIETNHTIYYNNEWWDKWDNCFREIKIKISNNKTKNDEKDFNPFCDAPGDSEHAAGPGAKA